MTDGKVNILIVDDKPEKVLALEALLEDLGQNIVRAYSGREALRCLLQDEFAVVLLDVNMPGMDGFETAALIRQRPSSRDVPIIFVTAFGDEGYSSRGYSLGAVDYIQTPVVPDVLRSKVAVFVELARKTQQVKRQADSLRRRAAQLQTLAAASVAINSALSTDKMLQTITDVARDVLGSHQAITLFTDPRPGASARKTQAFTSYSDKYAEWRSRPLELDAIVDTLVYRSHSAIRLSETELLDHPDWDIVRQVRVPPICGGMLAAPLTGRDGTRLGVIYLSDRRDGPFTADDEAVAVQLAQMASIAVENAIYAEEREANRIKDEFLSTLSHELRTPLNAILGWTQLLRMNPSQGDVVHGLDVIERNARAQAKLIDDLLDVSRITSGKLRLNRRAIRLGQVVDAAVDAIRPIAVENRISLDWSGCECEDTIVGDFDRLQQVAWNLLSNAVKFTPPEGQVKVRVEDAGDQLRLQVIDSGRGINPAFLPHVFDRFRQADSSSTRTHGGLGIGLTIVRRLTELHGGSVHADSAGENRGATFTVTLPRALAGMDQALLSPEPAAETQMRDFHPRAAAGPDSIAGVQVLLVDDDADTRDVIAQALQRAGAIVTSCASVSQALDEIARQLPDVIVSDIAMPHQDGYDLIRSVRTSASNGSIPAIALTAYARDEDRTKALLAGFQQHLAKPVEPAQLIHAITELASQRQTARSAAHQADHASP